MKILVTQRIPDQGVKLLKERIGAESIDYREEDGVLTKRELIQNLKGKDIVLSLLTDLIDKEVMDACPDLKMIANYAVGYNNIDIEEAKKRGIVVTNTPGVLTETTADLAFALIMAVARQVVPADRYMRAGNFKNWEPMGFLGHDVCGATLGIVGMGRIGRAVARRGALGFDMKVLYSGNHEVEGLNFEAEFVDLEDLLKRSDFVSLHVPLTDQTKYLIGEGELGLMKDSAYLINTARGPVVDESALIEILKRGGIAGAGLDVYENEPEFDKRMSELDNVVMLPHIGSGSWQTRQKMSMFAAENILDWIEGKELQARVV